MSTPAPADRLLTRDEVAQILRVHPDTVYDYIRRGDIPSIKIGHRRHVPAWFFRKLMGGEG